MPNADGCATAPLAKLTPSPNWLRLTLSAAVSASMAASCWVIAELGGVGWPCSSWLRSVVSAARLPLICAVASLRDRSRYAWMIAFPMAVAWLASEALTDSVIDWPPVAAAAVASPRRVVRSGAPVRLPLAWLSTRSEVKKTARCCTYRTKLASLS